MGLVHWSEGMAGTYWQAPIYKSEYEQKLAKIVGYGSGCEGPISFLYD